ncbi:MAG: flagellar hook-basal body complex protein FliE [Vampirovibrionales bacterium]|nr:flagellar hook-basal body complex protein FliE [Vampirovibrionales bacterium]
MVAPIDAFTNANNPFKLSGASFGSVSGMNMASGSMFGSMQGVKAASSFTAAPLNMPALMTGQATWQPPAWATPSVGATQANAPSFKGTLANMLKQANDSLSQPDQVLQDALSGNGKADVHDVMIANAKAELTVNIATQGATKILQGYDKITQIQI